MRKITVFYAWQSDAEPKFNRHLIRVALDGAAKRITEDSTVQAEVFVDADTEGVPGTPPVTDTILKKIAACDIFAPDLTFVARTESGKLVPNPNVMTEYGYALCAKTYEAMMPIMNTAYGEPDELPFDMGHVRHPVQYRIASTANDGERRATRTQLSAKLEQILRLQITATEPARPAPPPFPATELKDGPARFRAAGDPIGQCWDEFRAIPETHVSLASGPAMWLRVLPLTDPGRRWAPHELYQNARNQRLYLAPFLDNPIYWLRAEDGFGVCPLPTKDAQETTSVAFAFETGEVWSIDTSVLADEPTRLYVAETERLFTTRLEAYALFLRNLGIEPPYEWISGIQGAKNRRLVIPPPSGSMYIPGRPGPQCLADNIMERGTFDGVQTPANALYPFFKTIFDKSGVARPDYLPR